MNSRPTFEWIAVERMAFASVAAREDGTAGDAYLAVELARRYRHALELLKESNIENATARAEIEEMKALIERISERVDRL